jgi:hypothetical protein
MPRYNSSTARRKIKACSRYRLWIRTHREALPKSRVLRLDGVGCSACT